MTKYVAKADLPPSGELSQAEYSRYRGVSRKTVTVWKTKGELVLSASGLVDVAASDARLASRPQVNRGGVTSAIKATGNGNEPRTPAASKPPAAMLQGSVEEIAVSFDWSHAEAARVKEVYLALLRKQEFETAQGKLVEIEAVGEAVEREYAVVRERLLAIPGKLAAKLVDRDRVAIELALSEEINEALNELHDPDPDGRVGSAFGETGKGPRSSEAAAQA